MMKGFNLRVNQISCPKMLLDQRKIIQIINKIMKAKATIKNYKIKMTFLRKKNNYCCIKTNRYNNLKYKITTFNNKKKIIMTF